VGVSEVAMFIDNGICVEKIARNGAGEQSGEQNGNA